MTSVRSLQRKGQPLDDGEGETLDDALEPALGRVLTRVRLRARRRAEWLRSLWRSEASKSAFDASSTVTHHELDAHLDDRDAPAAEASWQQAHAGQGAARALAAVEAELEADRDSRLARLCRVFALSAPEVDVLHACLALALDPSLSRVYAYLHDHAARGIVTDELVARLFGHGRTLLLATDLPLLRWQLVHAIESSPSEPRARVLDPAIRDWLAGGDALDTELLDVARVQPELPPLVDWPVAQTLELLQRWLAMPRPTPARVLISGAPGSGRRTFAAVVAGQLGLATLSVDSSQLSDEAWDHVWLKAQRRAFLSGCALVFSGERAFTRLSPRVPALFPLQFFVSDHVRKAPSEPSAIDCAIALPGPSLAARRALWRHHAPWSESWPEPQLSSLLAQHRALPAELARVGRHGPTPPADAGRLLRESARDSFGPLAQRLVCPFARNDLVLSAQLNAALDELMFEACARASVWERPEAQRLFPQGRGLLALLSGPPGTGKTMSAQVIAAELGVDLYRIDLAAVVSKWVGETARNLDQILARANELDLVLLFDEADALFGKRSDVKEANDRFANTDTGYLLQAIESYRGIALLSTNRRLDIDPAFLRRLRYLLDYPLPDEADRARLWQRIVSELAGADRAQALEAGMRTLAAVEASGAQIKFSVLSAVFSAQREGCALGLRHLARGLERELAKEGRSLAERIRERLGSHAG